MGNGVTFSSTLKISSSYFSVDCCVAILLWIQFFCHGIHVNCIELLFISRLLVMPTNGNAFSYIYVYMYDFLFGSLCALRYVMLIRRFAGMYLLKKSVRLEEIISLAFHCQHAEKKKYHIIPSRWNINMNNESGQNA